MSMTLPRNILCPPEDWAHLIIWLMLETWWATNGKKPVWRRSVQTWEEKNKSQMSTSSGINQVQQFLTVQKTWCLTFAGFRAAKTVKQLTQEAMTSTGGEITVVNLVGEQCPKLSKMNDMTCSIASIFQFSLSESLLSAGMLKQKSPQLGTCITPGLATEHVWTWTPRVCDQTLTAATACRCGMWWVEDSLLSTDLYWWPYGPDRWWVWRAGSAESHLRRKKACDFMENNSFKITE